MGFKPQEDPSDSEADTGIVAEINITPLTDVFLVLLIIFMATTSVINQSGVSVNLPSASHQLAEAQAEGVIVTLLAGGGVKVNQTTLSESRLAELKPLLSAVTHSS